jgi:cytochrome c oxidase subunit 2
MTMPCRQPLVAGLCGAALAIVSTQSASVVARGGSDAGRPPASRTEVVEITAERFSFTPSEIHAKVGVPLEIRLESEDTDHGFRILGTNIDVRLPKRSKGHITVTFDPPAPGRYRFECSHVCGAGHSFMRGTIMVTK